MNTAHGRYTGANTLLRGESALLRDDPPHPLTGRKHPDYVWAQFDNYKDLGRIDSPRSARSGMPWACGWHRLPRTDFEIDPTEPCKWCGMPVTEQTDPPADYCNHEFTGD